MPTAFCHFTLIDVLGRGGMSTVYRARAQSTGQWVALKVLNRDMLDNPIARQRFDQEPTLQLLHPNIVHVLSAGICDGLPYFTMELIEGISMEQMLREQKRLTPRQLYPLVNEIASALDAAHRRNIVHRDIKPSNILIGTSAGQAQRDGRAVATRAFLTDFGVARANDAPRITSMEGLPVGTSSYMAPEQARNDETITPAADVYSLGVLVYHALAGRLPFRADNDLAMTHKHVSERPPELYRISPDIPRGVSSVVMRALRKSPAERWPSAGEFARTLNTAILQSQSRMSQIRFQWSWSMSIMFIAGLVLLISFIAATLMLRR